MVERSEYLGWPLNSYESERKRFSLSRVYSPTNKNGMQTEISGYEANSTSYKT